MENSKVRLGVLFGGKSAEHEVSLLSAKNIVDALDKEKYDIFLIGIDKTGEWRLREGDVYLNHADNPKNIQLQEAGDSLALVPQNHRKELVSYSNGALQEALKLDVIFPILHGTYGEDGTVQGLLQLANIPFVGAGVLGSAVGMDKDVMKRLLRDAHIPTAPFLTVHDYNRDAFSFESVVEKFGLPFFVKPANMGSSVGISKVKNKEDFEAALTEAFSYDHKILIEEFIQAREIECAVLGNEHPIASLPGEVIVQEEFYSYEAKYVSDSGTLFKIPVELPVHVTERIQQLAVDAYRVLCCEGMARVDFFLRDNGDVLVNEINTIPGFTPMSPYPKLWAASGLPLTELLDCLIEFAVERHEKQARLKTTF